MNTKDIIYEMLTENTGRHFLDSGFSEGRGWQKNQKKTLQDFEDEDVDKYEYSEWTDSKGNEHAELTRTVSVFHYLSELETDSICEKFNDVNTKSNNWDSPLYGVSKEAYQYITDEFDTDVVHEFNTYNGDSDLSQVLQGSWLNIDGETYLILQIHNGADVRGGYTDARMFICENGYINESIHEYIDSYSIQDELQYIEKVYVDDKLVDFTEEMKEKLS